jgi:hypothetical protein
VERISEFAPREFVFCLVETVQLHPSRTLRADIEGMLHLFLLSLRFSLPAKIKDVRQMMNRTLHRQLSNKETIKRKGRLVPIGSVIAQLLRFLGVGG